MSYLDFDLEIEEGSGGRDYRVVARSAAGDTRAVMRFPYDELALESALDKLQIALLRSGGPARRRILSPEEQAVQDFGRALFAALFSEDVRGLYDASRLKASQEGKDGVRLRLRVLAPELAALPWEYLYDPRQSSYLCLSRATPLVRYPEVAQPITPLRVTPPLRILGMIASPNDMDPLDVEREQGRMRAALKDLTAQGLVQLEWLPGQTWRHLQRAMRGGPWHIFHFIGHGGFHQGEGVLALADDDGKTSLLSATQLGYLLANHSALRLAVLNACEGARADQRDLFSSTAATLARRGLPAVLAMQYDITDNAAIEYTRTFYEALADRLPVDAALAEARAAIHLGIHNSLEWGTPVLYLRAPDGILFDLQGQATPPAPKGKTKEDWLKEGDTLVHYTIKRYEEALACYEQALALDPNFASALSGKAAALKGLKRYEEALTTAERAIQEDPQFARAYNNKGNILHSLKRYEEALAAYEHATQADPQFAAAHYNKGNTLRDLNRYEEALVAYDHAIQLDPQDKDNYYNKGDVLHTLKRYEEALAAFDHTIQIDPQFAWAYKSKGYTLYELKRPLEALAAYDRAIQTDPQFAAAYYSKGYTLYELKRYEEALAAFDRAIQIDPQFAAAYYNKGKALGAINRYEEALVAYDHAILANPQFAWAYNGKGNILYNFQRYEESLDAYDRAIQLDPQFAWAYHNKGNVLRIHKRYEEALTAYDHAIQLDPQDKDNHHNKGLALHDLWRNEEALAAYDRAIQIDPQFASAYYNKGHALKALKRYEEALVAYDRAFQLNHEFWRAYFDKADALRALGRMEESERASRQGHEYRRQHGISLF